MMNDAKQDGEHMALN